jgi:hypothetical protein
MKPKETHRREGLLDGRGEGLGVGRFDGLNKNKSVAVNVYSIKW